MKILPVTVLSGFVGAGKTSVLNHVVRQRSDRRIAVIVNNSGQEVSDSHLPPESSDKYGSALVQLSGGCICCSRRDDLQAEVLRIARSGGCDGIIIEASGISEPMAIAHSLLHAAEDTQDEATLVQLDTLVTVVDAESFLADLQSTEELNDRGLGSGEDDHREVSQLLADQVECANVILLNRTDAVSLEDVGELLQLLQILNPEARVIPIQHGKVSPGEVFETGRFQSDWCESAEAWQTPELLPGESRPASFSSLVFEARKPFHPRRFWDFWMDGEEAASIIRSKGHFWLATRHSVAGFWSQTGQILAAEPGGYWWAETPQSEWPEDDPDLVSEMERIWQEPFGDRRQELVLIGQNLNHDQLIAALNACLLTDEEMAVGLQGWIQLEDPFSPWTT